MVTSAGRAVCSTYELYVRLCRKVGFWRQNPKIGSWKINHFRVSTFLFSVICDRALRALHPSSRCALCSLNARNAGQKLMR